MTNQELLNSMDPDILYIVDYQSTWCGPCRMMNPILDEIQTNDVKVIKIDVDKEPELAVENSIKSIPTMFFVKNGKVLERHVGALVKKMLQDKINQF